MFTFHRTKFFDTYRTRFGPLTHDLVEAIEFLLGQIEQDNRFEKTEQARRQLAYCLATFKWETQHTMRPIDEFGSADYFNARYGPQTKVGNRLGNTQTGDGALFHGRGFVQLTGRINYVKAGKLVNQNLTSQPELAKNSSLAYQIAMQGMKDGWFTGKKLDQFISKDKAPEFERARAIINGSDKAQTIADLARRFDEVLIASI